MSSGLTSENLWKVILCLSFIPSFLNILKDFFSFSKLISDLSLFWSELFSSLSSFSLPFFKRFSSESSELSDVFKLFKVCFFDVFIFTFEICSKSGPEKTVSDTFLTILFFLISILWYSVYSSSSSMKRIVDIWSLKLTHLSSSLSSKIFEDFEECVSTVVSHSSSMKRMVDFLSLKLILFSSSMVQFFLHLFRNKWIDLFFELILSSFWWPVFNRLSSSSSASCGLVPSLETLLILSFSLVLSSFSLPFFNRLSSESSLSTSCPFILLMALEILLFLSLLIVSTEFEMLLSWIPWSSSSSSRTWIVPFLSLKLTLWSSSVSCSYSFLRFSSIVISFFFKWMSVMSSFRSSDTSIRREVFVLLVSSVVFTLLKIVT